MRLLLRMGSLLQINVSDLQARSLDLTLLLDAPHKVVGFVLLNRDLLDLLTGHVEQILRVSSMLPNQGLMSWTDYAIEVQALWHLQISRKIFRPLELVAGMVFHQRKKGISVTLKIL